jgi:single-stranded DNA-binding protein
VKFEGESQVTTFTLVIQENTREGSKPFTLFVGCTSWGRSAETASLLNADDLVAIQGKLTWRKHLGKCGQEHSQLCVHVRECALLESAVEVPT